MYAYIEGKLTHKDPAYSIIEAGGVGYEIKISLQTYAALPHLGERCKLQVFQSIREDAHVLFGFFDLEEKQLFLLLTGISGIGPSTALVMLSSLSALEIINAIVHEDIRTLQSIKGLGPKTAQRVVLELKDKLKKDNHVSNVLPSSGGHTKMREEALSALTTLGVQRAVAEKSVDAILKKEGGNITLEQLIKQALR